MTAMIQMEASTQEEKLGMEKTEEEILIAMVSQEQTPKQQYHTKKNYVQIQDKWELSLLETQLELISQFQKTG